MGVANSLIALYIIQPPDANKDDKVTKNWSNPKNNNPPPAFFQL